MSESFGRIVRPKSLVLSYKLTNFFSLTALPPPCFFPSRLFCPHHDVFLRYTSQLRAKGHQVQPKRGMEGVAKNDYLCRRKTRYRHGDRAGH